jgi:hypothetical protein
VSREFSYRGPAQKDGTAHGVEIHGRLACVGGVWVGAECFDKFRGGPGEGMLEQLACGSGG